MSTNPAYKELAYRRSILRFMINFMMTDVVGASGAAPKRTIICEDVFDCDKEIGQDTILDFVEELQEIEADLKVELGKFEFRKKDEQSKLAARLKTGGKKTRSRKAKTK